VVLAESPVREVLCPGCLLGRATLAESDNEPAELESDDVITESAPRPAVGAPAESTMPGCALVSTPAAPE
jgi:hypothetical protein